MKKITIRLSVLILVVSSCGQATKRQTETEINIEQNDEKLETVVTIPQENTEENFKMFLEKFGTDSLFQVSRIVFPLRLLEYAGDDYGNITDSVIIHAINLENYTFLGGFTSNLSRIEIYGYEYPTESDIKAFIEEGNEYFAEVMARSVMKISEDEYFVHFFAMEAGGRSGYYFKKDDNGQWYLVEIDAKST